MDRFIHAHANGDTWQQACESCIDRLASTQALGNLGFVYVTDVLSHELRAVVASLRKATGVQDWVGTVGIGICASGAEYSDVPAISVMIGTFPVGQYQLFDSIGPSDMQLPRDFGTGLQGNAACFGVIHGDPRSAELPGLMADFCASTSSFLVGGLVSSRSGMPQVAIGVKEGGVSGVLFSQSVSVMTGLTQGCTPIGSQHIVTECQDNILKSLDERPAVEVFSEDIGELLACDFQRVPGYIFAALPVKGSDTADYVVRNLLGIDLTSNWLAIGALVNRGDPIMFVRRDPSAAEQDLRMMLGKLKKRLHQSPRGGLYFSCLARGANMFGRPGKELQMIQEALGDFPVTGFFANGEISNNRLYSYTGVLAVFL